MRSPCDECNGNGVSECPSCDGKGHDYVGAPCGNCDSMGDVECERCDGWGELEAGLPLGADPPVMGDILDFMLTAANHMLKLAATNRATRWQDGTTPESDTDHSCMLAVIAPDVARALRVDLNIDRLAYFGVVHDALEVYTDDVDTSAGLSAEAKANKRAAEAAALQRLHQDMPGSHFADMVRRYERQEEPEARFVRVLDKIMPKLTHRLNGYVTAPDREVRRARGERQRQELEAEYPEQTALFDLWRAWDAHTSASDDESTEAQSNR